MTDEEKIKLLGEIISNAKIGQLIIDNQGTVTYNEGGEKPNTKSSNESIKKIIEGLVVDGTMTNDNQWYAIRRVLSDKNIAPKKLADFLSYIDSLKLEGVKPYNNDNVKKVGTRCTRLSVDVMAWSELTQQSDAEQSQVIIATKMLAQLT